MKNAKQELLQILNFIEAEIYCAHLYSNSAIFNNKTNLVLMVGYNEKDLSAFLSVLDFDYEKGWGNQFVFGNVWLKDGTWLERVEIEDTEFWVHRFCPDISNECKN